MMLVLSFVLGHVLRRLIVGVLANISNTETNISCSGATCLVMILFSWQKPVFSNFGAIVTFAIFGTFLASMVTGIPVSVLFLLCSSFCFWAIPMIWICMWLKFEGNVLSEKSCFIWAKFLYGDCQIVREFEEWTKKSWRIDSDLQTVEMKMQKISRSVKEMELAQQAVYSKKKKVSWSW
ncbi:hypothetical protein CUMW_259530 [Citrus unshiu]|uniref:Uncharacterized protein n=1 Tax=Citrus unshiu TaxID=55188 RepID=A0A2H5QTC3_CITUN|nr:hypothetical protein CUMW_259530 [Citrus unshiu]